MPQINRKALQAFFFSNSPRLILQTTLGRICIRSGSIR